MKVDSESGLSNVLTSAHQLFTEKKQMHNTGLAICGRFWFCKILAARMVQPNYRLYCSDSSCYKFSEQAVLQFWNIYNSLNSHADSIYIEQYLNKISKRREDSINSKSCFDKQFSPNRAEMRGDTVSKSIGKDGVIYVNKGQINNHKRLSLKTGGRWTTWIIC